MTRGIAALLLFVLLVVWFGTLDHRRLVRPDEGRYAEIALEMAQSGDWLTPRLNGIKYFFKPPLQYWATATAYTAFGFNEWTSRLWPAITGFLGVLFTGFVGMRLFGRESGLYAAAILASSFLYLGISRINTLDMGLTFFMTLSLGALLLALRPDGGRGSPGARRGWMLLFWAGCALAVLSKGLVGLVLPVAVVVLYALLVRDFGLWRRLELLPGLALFLLIAAPWFVAVSLANPEFARFFFIHEHFERFLTKVHARYQPWYAFIPVLLVGFMPWTLTLLATAWRGLRAESGSWRPRWLLMTWAAFIFLFFSASSSKLPSYILPVFPALALLMGAALARLPARTLVWQLAPMLPLALAGLYLSPHIFDWSSEESPGAYYADYWWWVVAAAALWFIGTAAAVGLAWRQGRTASVLTMAATGVLCGQLVLLGHDSLHRSASAWWLVQQIRDQVDDQVPFYSVGMYEQTLSPYLGRNVIVVQHESELDFGIVQEPGRGIPTVEAFLKVWHQPGPAFAVMPPGVRFDLRRHMPMEIIAADTRRVVVKKPDWLAAGRAGPLAGQPAGEGP